MSEIRSRLLRRLRKTQKRLAKIDQELLQALSWEKTHHEADLLQSYFHLLKRGQSQVSLPDWKRGGGLTSLLLDPSKTPQELIAKRYRQARKAQRSIPHLEQEKCFLLKKKEEWERWLALCEEDESLAQEALPPIPPPPQKRPPPLPFRRFTTKSGLKILVGRNAQENEELTFKVAKGSDWWFHIDGESGSHVVLQVPRGEEADQEAMTQAMENALRYSKRKSQGEGSVIYTQVKHVKKPRHGKLGEVLIAHSRFRRLSMPQEMRNTSPDH